MPFRDHFRSPVNDKHRWEAVHGQWPGEIVRTLFELLPPGFQAEPKVYHGSLFQVDVSMTEDDDRLPTDPTDVDAGGTATLTASAPTLTVPADLSELDEYGVRVYDVERGRTLVAAIELISPSNKDRPESRDQFVSKVAALLRQDVCVSVVDIVSIRQANLYVELLRRLGRSDPGVGDPPPTLYAVTLRGRKSPKGRGLLDAWFFPLFGRPTDANDPAVARPRPSHRVAARLGLPGSVPVVAHSVG
jgi:hypothetical protein